MKLSLLKQMVNLALDGDSTIPQRKAVDVELTAQYLLRIEDVSPKHVVHGTRYMQEQMTLLDG